MSDEEYNIKMEMTPEVAAKLLSKLDDVAFFRLLSEYLSFKYDNGLEKILIGMQHEIDLWYENNPSLKP